MPKGGVMAALESWPRWSCSAPHSLYARVYERAVRTGLLSRYCAEGIA
jgi:hypothetical protein